MALKLGIETLRSYFKIIYEFHILPNRKIATAKYHGKNYIKVRPPLVRHLYRNRSILLFVLSNVDGNGPKFLSSLLLHNSLFL